MGKKENNSGKQEAIRVVARVRPLLPSEASRGKTIAHVHSETQVRLERADERARCYDYDRVLGPDAANEAVFDEACLDVVSGVLDGINGAVLTYGQTASGKTHTMTGTADDEGLVPRTFRTLFAEANRRAHASMALKSTRTDFSITLACFQIYDEGVECLLTGATGADRVVRVTVPSWARAAKLLELADKRRRVARTDMNERSSRSHTLFHASVTSDVVSKGLRRSSELFMVDLAGSESIDKTGSTGATLQQAKYINVSLLALRRVVTALVEKKNHIPYRDSRLTLALSRAVGGNSRTCLVICVSPSEYNRRETIAALEFGIYSSTVRNYAAATVTASAAMLEKRLRSLQADLSDLQGLRINLLAQQGQAAAAALETPRRTSAAWKAWEYPDEFVCPLTGELMADPWLLADGCSYEKDAALEYLRVHGRPPGPVLSGVPEAYLAVAVPNHALKGQINTTISKVNMP